MTDSIPLITPPSPACAPRCRGGDLAAVPGGGAVGHTGGLDGPAKRPDAGAGLGMSAIVFAGAAQLVAMGMIKGGAGLLAILLSIFSSPPSIFLCAAAAGAHCAAAVTLAADPGILAYR